LGFLKRYRIHSCKDTPELPFIQVLELLADLGDQRIPTAHIEGRHLTIDQEFQRDA